MLTATRQFLAAPMVGVRLVGSICQAIRFFGSCGNLAVAQTCGAPTRPTAVEGIIPYIFGMPYFAAQGQQNLMVSCR